MTDRIEIDVRRADGRAFTLQLPAPFTLESDQLDRAMERCNKQFGDPTKNIGGPRLPTIDSSTKGEGKWNSASR